MILKFVKRQ